MPVPRNNYQLQANGRRRSMTVKDLVEKLLDLPPDMPVVILSPEYGAFGSEMPYDLASVEDTFMPRMERKIPATEYRDEDTGEPVDIPEEMQVWPEWRGVILQGR